LAALAPAVGCAWPQLNDWGGQVRRTISIVVAGVLTIGVVFTILASERESSTKHLRVVHGITSTENGPFFDDARVKSAFAANGLAVQVDTVTNDQVVTAADLSKYDFAFLTESATAAKIATGRHITNTFVPFHSPMVVATLKDVAQRLTKAGIAQEHAGWWTLDTRRYLDLVRRHVRWDQLPGNAGSHDNRPVFITSPGITTSEGAMYAALASSVANNSSVVGSQAQVDKIVNAVSPLFLVQGPAQTSAAVFSHYTQLGGLAPPMVWTSEARFVAHAAVPGTIHPDSALMYPTPGVSAAYTLLPFTPAGSEAGRLLTTDPTLQRLAVENGFRTKAPAALAGFARQNGVEVPMTLPSAIPLPTYDNLEALVIRVDAALLAARGQGPTTAATSQSVPSPGSTGPNRTGQP
jgi:hypothetical protein